MTRKKAATDKPSRLSPFKNTIPYLVLIILLFLSALAWQYYERAMLEREEQRYNEYVDFVVGTIIDRLHQYEMILRGAAGVFAASEEVTRDEWRVYYEYQEIGSLYPGFRGLQYLKIIQPAELAQHIAEIRAEGFSDYTVWPEGERNIYVPLVYKEPPSGDDRIQGVLGFDMYTDTERKAVLERAQDTGEVSLSGRLTKLTEDGQDAETGHLLAVPVYNRSMPHNTIAEREAALEGYVAVSFHFYDLMATLFSEPINKIDFRFYDGSGVVPENLLYDSHITQIDNGAGHKPLFASQQTLDLYGHQFALDFETTPAFEATVDQVAPKGIFAFGLLFSFLIFFYLKTLANTGNRAQTLAQKMTNALRESEEQLKKITDNVTDAVALCNLERNVTYMSPQSHRVLGFSPEELLGKPIFTTVCEEDLPAVMQQFNNSLEAEEPGNAEYRIATKDGRLVWVETRGDLLYENGQVSGAVFVTRDITGRKQLEEQINESRKMYKSVVDTQQEMVCRYLPDATLTFVNDAYCRHYGKKRQEMLGHRFLEFTPPELHNEILELINSLTPDNPSVRHEHYVLLPDGSIRWQEWTEQALFTKTGEIKEYQGVGRDITERVQAEGDLLQAYDATIEGWAHALDLKDEETEGHSQRVTERTVDIARHMGMKDEELAHLRRGALLHDIGKMGIPDSILLKPGKLTEEEWEVMRKHPVFAYEMLAPVDYLRPALDIPYCHHEKWDGTGYPRGLKGKAIPLPARIFAVVDVYDALTSDRPYRKAWSEEDALALIKEDSGSHFDPEVVEVFLKEIGNQT